VSPNNRYLDSSRKQGTSVVVLDADVAAAFRSCPDDNPTHEGSRTFMPDGNTNSSGG